MTSVCHGIQCVENPFCKHCTYIWTIITVIITLFTRGHSTGPRRNCWQMIIISLCRLRVLVGVLLPTPATRSSTIIVVDRCSQDAFTRSSRRVWTTATPVNAIRRLRHLTTAITGRPKHWHAFSLASEVVTTLIRSCSNYNDSEPCKWNLRLLFWPTRHSTTWHHGLCQTIVSS